MELKIDPEFEALIPPLDPAELEQLHRSLRAGCRDKLIVWMDKDIIIDGHNRYKFCTENNIPFEVQYEYFNDRNNAKNFIILNQLGRRNVTPDVARLLRGMLYNSRKKEQGEHKGNQYTKMETCQNGSLEETADIVAKETGVSPRTIHRDAKFAKEVEEAGKTADVLAGKVKKRDLKKTVEAPRDWDWDKDMKRIYGYLYRNFGNIPATDKAEFRDALIEKMKGLV